MPYVQKRPKIMKAEQFLTEDKPWPKGVVYMEGSYHVDNPHLTMIEKTDWVVTDITGNLFVITDVHFKEMYEIVEDIKPR